jgi:hypothetical protein
MNQVNRRNFFRLAGTGAAAAATAPVGQTMGSAKSDQQQQQAKPATNIADAAKTPRGSNAMPGLFPGRVALVKNSDSVKDNAIAEQEVYDMIARSMLELTGEKKLKKAWRKFVGPGERIGLKVNQVAVDRIGYDIVLAKRIAEGLQKEGSPSAFEFMLQAERLGLGGAHRAWINLKEVILG